MKNFVYFISIVIILLFVQLNRASDDFVLTNNLTSNFCGIWTTEASACQLIVTSIGSYLEIKMIDTSEFERSVDISNVKVFDNKMYFTSNCKVNNCVVHHKISFINNCILVDIIDSNRTKNNKVIWRKKQCQIPNGS